MSVLLSMLELSSSVMKKGKGRGGVLICEGEGGGEGGKKGNPVNFLNDR